MRQASEPGAVATTPGAGDVAVEFSRIWLDRRIADRHLRHETPFGMFATLPNGADRSATIDTRGLLPHAALRAVRAFIFDNLAGELTIARLAEVARLSRYHFSRAFTRATGVPPHRYIMQARADRAAAAIRRRRQSLAEIAYAHGFTDQSHMCRWIRRRYGTTPTGLRKGGAIR